MKFIETPLKGAYVISLEKREDERGYFARFWDEKTFKEMGLNTNITQVNISRTLNKGTLRGMHYQADPHGETKLIRCFRGKIYDVIIDMRKDSPTYKKWFGRELSQENPVLLYIPEGFAHGFVTLTDDVEVLYMVTAAYSAESERGVRYNDPEIAIEWPIEVTSVSLKDGAIPLLKKSK